MTSPFINFENLTKSFYEGGQIRPVLSQASAQFQVGEIVAILGKSGSGKSTLLNLLSGIEEIDQGSIWIGGQNITLLDEQQRTLYRRKNIGIIFQFFNLIPTLTVLENVSLPAEINGVNVQAARQRAEPLLEAVELSDRLNTFPDRLSGGNNSEWPSRGR